MKLPIEDSKWQGDICCMCNGTGEDAWPVTVQHGIFLRVVGWVKNGKRCRACNGHGKDASVECV